MCSSSPAEHEIDSGSDDSLSSAIKRTPLFDWHVAHHAKMVPFAGWEMPVQYQGVIAEHHAVRTAAGLFDLGHMGQVNVSGPDAETFLQAVTTNDVAALAPGDAQYSLLPNERGGVIDDIIIYRRSGINDGYMVVVNAANSARDVAWLIEQTGMIAIQGPNAEEIVAKITDANLGEVPAFTWQSAKVNSISTMLARTGYTGEDGFEFYTDIVDVSALWRSLVNEGESLGLVPVGLGARDTLRLEARMPLYGNELGEDISPLEAGVGWAVKLNKNEFVGKDAMEKVKRDGPRRRTVGFQLTERGGVPRAHFPVVVGEREVGYVTSGAFSPTLHEHIGLALVEREVAGVGRPLSVEIRGKPVAAVQIQLPFYKRDRAEEST